MLGERSDQRGLWEADRLYLDHVGRESFYGLLASLRGRLFRVAARQLAAPCQKLLNQLRFRLEPADALDGFRDQVNEVPAIRSLAPRAAPRSRPPISPLDSSMMSPSLNGY